MTDGIYYCPVISVFPFGRVSLTYEPMINIYFRETFPTQLISTIVYKAKGGIQ